MNKKLFLSILTTLTCITIQAQSPLAVHQLDVHKLPAGIKYEGKIKTAVRWTDSAGDNIVITTETGVHESKKQDDYNGNRDAELFAYHFLVKNNAAVQTWKVHDFVLDCEVDVEASFIKNTFHVTDLNKDGVGEVWLMYKTVCHGDVSPCEMKIIMYQGQQKFAMRGQNKVMDGIDDKGVKHYTGGEYKFDEAFASGPKEFVTFAKKLWNDNIMQQWGV